MQQSAATCKNNNGQREKHMLEHCFSRRPEGLRMQRSAATCKNNNGQREKHMLEHCFFTSARGTAHAAICGDVQEQQRPT